MRVTKRPAKKRKIAPVQTRQRLIDATVSCLVKYGYGGTTTQRVQTAAGVSRGALLHHFPTKPSLFVGAIHHVAETQAGRMRELAENLPDGDDRVAACLAALREAMSGDLFLAGVELWMAARTDEAMRATLIPAERQVGKDLSEIAVLLFGEPYASGPGFAVTFDSLLELLRGLALTGVLRTDPRMEEQVLAAWRAVFADLCARTPVA